MITMSYTETCPILRIFNESFSTAEFADISPVKKERLSSLVNRCVPEIACQDLLRSVYRD
jgi:hypothetical protein